MVSHPENGSDSPIGSDRDWGRDSNNIALVVTKIVLTVLEIAGNYVVTQFLCRDINIFKAIENYVATYFYLVTFFLP